jgi:hypothetical protein
VIGLQVSPRRYSTYEQRIAFSERLLTEVQTLPGVQSVALGNGGLPFGGPQSNYSIEGQPDAQAKPIQLGLISSDYPKTMGIPLRAGRELNSDEIARAEPVALVNETAAKLWPDGSSPIGRRLRIDILARPSATAPGMLKTCAPSIPLRLAAISVRATSAAYWYIVGPLNDTRYGWPRTAATIALVGPLVIPWSRPMP